MGRETHDIPTAAPAPATASPLLARLLARGWQFDFFQAVWLLERTRPDRMPVGYGGPVARELLRFRPDVSLGFPPTDVRRIATCGDPGGDDCFHQIEATFLGLYGVATPLPLHYAIGILRSVKDPDEAPAGPAPAAAADRTTSARHDTAPTPARDFLDILHHRLISLFYRTWTKYRHYVTFGMRHSDPTTGYLLRLIGLSPTTAVHDVGVPPVRLIRYAGILTQHPRSATTLEGMLLDYWETIPVRVGQFVGRWVTLTTADCNRIGVANSRLGADLTVGEQVYDLSGAFEVSAGPMDWGTYLSFLPGGVRHKETASLVRLYCADPLSCTIEARLRAGEIPEMRLSSDAAASRLGYTSWVRTSDMAETSVRFSVN